MSFRDRIQEAAYTGPESGTRITFLFGDLEKAWDAKGSERRSPSKSGSYVQSLGFSGQRFPMTIKFSGPDYDLEAEAFEALLREKGYGLLEHPLYKRVNVVPLGRVSRKDRVVTAGAEAIFELEFIETLETPYPSATRDSADGVFQSVSKFNETSANQYAASIESVDAVGQAATKNRTTLNLAKAREFLGGVAEKTSEVLKVYNDIERSINSAIDTLVAEPFRLASQINTLIQLPARVFATIQTRLQAYRDLFASLADGSDKVESPTYGPEGNNNFRSSNVFAAASVTGQIISAMDTDFQSQPEAIEAAIEIQAIFEDYVVWAEDNLGSLSEIDTGEAYQDLVAAVSLASGFLVELSFDLNQERIIVLDRDRVTIEFVAEIYGEIDSRLDFFADSNNLAGDEMLLLPKGRELVVYL